MARVDELEERPWDPDAAAESDEYLLASIEQLGDDSEVLRTVQAEEFDVLNAKNLPDREFLFYAMIAGPKDHRIVFIRKFNLRRGVKNRLITLFGETLGKITDPIFTFDSRADMVLDPRRGLAILGLSAFQMLFRSSPEMVARTPDYVEEIADSLPMSSASIATLVEVALGNMNVNRRLQSIVSRGHLVNVTLDEIRKEMLRHDLDVGKFIVDGKLTFDKADSKEILKLLNEDLFRGGLTNQGYQVDRKSPR
ncbi:hypothetical protein L3Q67_07710 [Saccharothrix sp. AJ9571]|nr:hypothetical protein L3Q67_07710 [Saccharothrix sp. AJ9571]